jgi:drug/metabolite transporter (DMT)-like permease
VGGAATLTVLTGVDPILTTAITFAIGGSVVALAALARGGGRLMRPTRASLALGVYGLFGYHTLYFAALRLAPPAEAQLICSLWALFIVLFSGLLPGNRLRGDHVLGALLGLLAASLLVWPKLGAGTTDARAMIGFSLAFGCALVWSTYSVAWSAVGSRAERGIAVSCLATWRSRFFSRCSSSGFGLTV